MSSNTMNVWLNTLFEAENALNDTWQFKIKPIKTSLFKLTLYLDGKQPWI